jgi:solute carrier family 12 sodium/potassium/chloride transporter 2
MAVNQFQRKQKKGYIDVWWLYDDGGLTLLLPYLLSTRGQWKGCSLRVFALANKKDELDTEQRNMAALLSKFRIDYSDVIVIPDIVKPPQESSKKAFKDLISKFRIKDIDNSNCDLNGDESESENNNKLVITDSELLALKDKVRKQKSTQILVFKFFDSNFN